MLSNSDVKGIDSKNDNTYGILEDIECEGAHYKLHGSLCPLFWDISKVEWLRNNYKPSNNEIWIATYPKNGTTVLQYLCQAIMQCYYQKTKSKNHLYYNQPKSQSVLVLNAWIEYLYSLDSSNPENNNSEWDQFIQDTQKTIRFWKTHTKLSLFPSVSLPKKMIIIARNPKDVCVSFYYHLCNDTDSHNFENTSFDTYFQLFIAGLLENESYFDWYKKYWNLYQNNDGNSNTEILWIYYEDLIRNNESKKHEIRKIIDFVGVSDVVNSDMDISGIVKAISKETMREQLNKANTNFFLKFIRKGIIGDWKTHLNKTQSNIIDALIKLHFNGTKFKYWMDLCDEKDYLCWNSNDNKVVNSKL